MHCSCPMYSTRGAGKKKKGKTLKRGRVDTIQTLPNISMFFV